MPAPGKFRGSGSQGNGIAVMNKPEEKVTLHPIEANWVPGVVNPEEFGGQKTAKERGLLRERYGGWWVRPGLIGVSLS